MSLLPYAGLTFRYNISGQRKYEFDDSYRDEDEKLNIFDDEDMGKEGVYKRFQIGWQIGLNARFNDKFFIGVGYGSDFSEICKKAKIHTTSISLGVCF